MDLNDTMKMELSDNELSSTEIAEEASLLPEKSKFKYEKQFQLFTDWCNYKQIKQITEDVLVEYFNEKAKKFKSSTLWGIFSMLRPTLLEQKELDIKTFKKLLAFLKQQSVGYKPKKSKVLQRSDIYRFLVEAPDKQYLMKKVALIVGLAGACHRDELVYLSIDDIIDQNSIILIKIPDAKRRTTRTFSLKNNGANSPDLISYYRKYAALRPSNAETRRFFVKYSNGVCSRQVVGINTIGKIPREVASYLGIRDFDAYTGHCFRSSSESFLADAGGYMGFKFSTVTDMMSGRSGTRCAILKCNSKRKNGVRMFQYTNVYDNHKLWLENCQISPLTRTPILICSHHFEPQCFLNGKLKKSAVPTLFLSNQQTKAALSETCNLQNNFPAVGIDEINSNQETGLSEFESGWESVSIKACMATENNPCMPTDTIKEEPETTLDEIKKEPSVSLSDENSSFDDTEEAYSSTNDECSNCPIQDESPMRQDLQMCNTNSSISCNCSNRLIRLENNQEEIKMKLDQLLDLVRDITIRFRN